MNEKKEQAGSFAIQENQLFAMLGRNVAYVEVLQGQIAEMQQTIAEQKARIGELEVELEAAEHK